MITALSVTAFQTSLNDDLKRWDSFSRNVESVKLSKWIHNSAVTFLKGKNPATMKIKTPPYFGKLGLFVTIVKDRKVRGCFGAFSHSSDSIDKCLRRYIKGALYLDPRYKKIEIWELEDSEVILTVASQPVEVNSLNDIDISMSGVLIEKEGQPGTVIVPAEYITESSMKSAVKCSSDCHIYKFNAVTIKNPESHI